MERDLFLDYLKTIQQISTHTLTWSVTLFLTEKNGIQKFQLTRSRGAWLRKKYPMQPFTNFNSHAHVERDALKFYNDKTTLNFNSHAHVERDNCLLCSKINFYISTHTLTWSVTVSRQRFVLTTWISTHTLTWSVTVRSADVIHRNAFQLTRSRGAWPWRMHGMQC